MMPINGGEPVYPALEFRHSDFLFPSRIHLSYA